MAELTLEQARRKAWELLHGGEFRAAETVFEHILGVSPRDAELWHILGFLASWDRRFALAETRLREALRLRPGYPEALNTLGSLLDAKGESDGALKMLNAALGLKPDFLEALYNRGRVLQALDRFEEAEGDYRKVLQQMPEAADAHNNLGLVYQQLGNPERALACFQAAMDCSAKEAGQRRGATFSLKGSKPQDGTRPDPRFHSNFLMALNYVDKLSPEEIKQSHLDWGRTHGAALAPGGDPFPEHPGRERLRIGYVSADFRKHSVAFFVEGVLKAHDRERFEIFAYYAHPFEDLVSQRMKGYVDHWIPCAAMEDEELARRIRRDGIDILVDLAGHSQGNRLLAFARRAAPVQVSWIGYQNTTGLSAMDYRLTDRFADPEGETEQLYTERLVRLPIRQCFEPPQDAPDVSPLPALGSGRITFGSFNAFRKITPACLDLWAQVLRTLPEARLLMLEAGSTQVQEFLNTAFSDRGVAPERLELRGKVSFQDFLSLHAQVDIAFDPYPYGGGTTTCLGLCMGVPVVTLQGPSIASRSGARLLAPMGMEDWIARDAEAYVRVAVEKARDLEALARLREGLRSRMRNSALGHPQTLTRALEETFRNMMETWHRTHAAQVGDSHAGS